MRPTTSASATTNNGGAQNLTGSPDYNARIYYIADPGSGCSSDQYRQFNVTAVSGPTYNSTQMESGRNRMRGCPDKRVDMSLSRDIRMGGNRRLEFRLDVFNAVRRGDLRPAQPEHQLQQPDRPHRPQLAVRWRMARSIPTRLVPRNAGFGAATRRVRDAQLCRSSVRFAF